MIPQALQANLAETISSSYLQITALPLCPDIRLYLLAEDYPRGRLDHDEMLAILSEPAYWAFCWASGQVLARYLMQHRELVAGKRVLDFGSGSGVVGIAAALAGAAEVIACDLDPKAIAATEHNAALNDVHVRTLTSLEELRQPVHLAIAADVLYDRDNMPVLQTLPRCADSVLLADSRIKSRSIDDYEIVGEQEATTIPDLDEFKEFNRVRIFRSSPPGPE